MYSFLSNQDSLELRQTADTVRRFAESELTHTAGEPFPYRREIFTRMGELGLTAMSIGEQFGGSALGPLAIAATIFEVSRIQVGPAIYLSVHLMVSRLLGDFYEGKDKPALLQSLASGKKLAAYCLTEAQAGSDAAALKTRALKKGAEWILDGEKVYISSAGLADTYLVFARTGGDGPGDISAFVVDRNAPGISFGKHEKKMGGEGSPIGSVSFENCRVPESALVGAPGQGYRIALSGLSGGRVNIAACSCGVSSRALERAVTHLKERRQFGKPLAQFQGLQFMVADMAMKLRASILLAHDAAAQLARGETDRAPASLAKCFASDSAMSITTDAVQLLGGAGYIAEYEVERLMRDAKMLQIVEGTNQIQRILIARSLFGEAMEG